MGCNNSGIFSPTLKCGPRNLITDVAGVTVGHTTLKNGEINTGVTAVVPHGGNTFTDKLPAACCVINGFGKTTGLMQIQELGTLETPIILTNTLSVGTAYTALVKLMLEKNPDIGVSTGTVNPVVCECNDGTLNDIRGLHVTEEHVFEAVSNASEDFPEGAVGAGTGMSCYGLKGGIGSASRVVTLDNKDFTLGCLVMTNHSNLRDFRLKGKSIAELTGDVPDKGSVIVILATDAPVSGRQLGRICRRAVAGLCREGSVIGHGSGEVVIGFSTAYTVPHSAQSLITQHPALHEDGMDPLFRATAEVVEDAVLSSLLHAETTAGARGNVKKSLMDHLREHGIDM